MYFMDSKGSGIKPICTEFDTVSFSIATKLQSNLENIQVTKF